MIYCISSWGGGKGGHFNTLASYLKNQHSYMLLVIGRSIPSALERFSPIKVWFDEPLPFVIKSNNLVHCFDQWSFLYILYRKSFGRIILTKSGGKNAFFFPYAPYMYLISLENYDFYRRRMLLKTIEYHPGRIIPFEHGEKLPIDNPNNDLFHLRVGRISKYYEKGLRRFAQLASTNDGVFVVIGIVEDVDLARYLKNCGVMLFTQEEFTANAKMYLNSNFYFYGQGRSLMEAYSIGCKCFVYSAVKNDYIELTEYNFLSALKHNFSERFTGQNDQKQIMVDAARRMVIFDGDKLLSFYKCVGVSRLLIYQVINLPLLLKLRLKMLK